MQPFIVIGHPGDRRTEGIKRAREKLGLPPAVILPYAGFLEGRHLGDLLAAQAPEVAASLGAAAPLLRLEAPGGAFGTERALIALGAPDAVGADNALHPDAARRDPLPLSVKAAGMLKEMPGVLHHPSQWFRGYCRMLARLRREAAEAGLGGDWQNDPAEIAAMTDKRQTQRILAGAGVPVPRPLGGAEPPVDYDSLRAKMAAERMHRVFIKLAYGSAASGVIAYQVNPVTGAELATTTVGAEHFITRPPVYYNSGKLRRYTDRSVIAGIINWLYRHGAYAEQWLPKATHRGLAFDIRQLVVLDEPCHAVARCSTTPITNLHLRSTRMTPAEAGLSPEGIAQVQNTAREALAAFPRSSVAGMDVLVTGSKELRTSIADVNPFGDLLYEVEHQGYGTYEWEMKRLAERQPAAPSPQC